MFLGHLEALYRVGMEGGVPALGAEQPDVDEVDGRTGGVAGVSRHME